MKRIIRRSVPAAAMSLAALLLILSPVRSFAQQTPGDAMTPPPPQQQQQQETNPPGNQDGDLVRQLNLTPEQIEKIRAIREQNVEARRSNGIRVRQARQALDRAIYLENADETVIEARVRELVEAQAAVMRLQALTELNIRRVLTAEQLNTLRALRFERARLEQERNRRLRVERNRQMRENGNQPTRRDALNPNITAPPKRRAGNAALPVLPNTRRRNQDLLRGSRRP